eukprot:scaffold2041_cov37-Cyclotella_meneghiniana.AAC.2
MDQDNVRDLFKKKGKPKQSEIEKKPNTQTRNPWSMVIVQPEEYMANMFKQNDSNEDSGKGRGRGKSTERGVRGNPQVQNQSDFVPDRHNGAYPPPTKWTKEQIEIYNHIANTLTNGVEEDIIEDLTEREGDEILIHLLMEKVQYRQSTNKKKKDIVRVLRLNHRSLLLNAINEEHAYNEIVNLLKVDNRKIGIETPLSTIPELYSVEGKRAMYAKNGPQRKKA